MKISSQFAAAYLKLNKNRLGLVIIAGIINSCISFLLPVSIGEFFMLHYKSGSSKGRLLELLGIGFSSLSAFFYFFGMLVLAKACIYFTEQWLSLKEGERFVKSLREKLFSTQLFEDEEIFKAKPYGNYLLRYSNDLKAVKTYLLAGILGTYKDAIFLLTGFVLLAMIHFKLSLYLILFFSLLLFIIYFIARFQRTSIQQSRDKRSNLLAHVTKSFSRYSRIRKERTELQSINRFNQKSASLYEANMKNNFFEVIQQALIPFLQFTMLGILLMLSTSLHPHISHGDALVFVLVTMMLFSPMKRLLKVPAILNKGKLSLLKIEEIIANDITKSSDLQITDTKNTSPLICSENKLVL